MKRTQMTEVAQSASGASSAQATWESINWNKMKRSVYRLQTRIAKAMLNSNRWVNKEALSMLEPCARKRACTVLRRVVAGDSHCLSDKLHFICDMQGQFLGITPGHVDDRKPLMTMTKFLRGKWVGDKGYISKNLAEQLLQQGVKLITGLKKGMKNKLLSLFDRALLKKRSLIESVFNQLKNTFHMEHSRHRNPINGLMNILAALAAYIHYPNKPAVTFN